MQDTYLWVQENYYIILLTCPILTTVRLSGVAHRRQILCVSKDSRDVQWGSSSEQPTELIWRICLRHSTGWVLSNAFLLIEWCIFVYRGILMWRFMHNCDPSYWTDKMIYAYDVHTYNTSNARNMLVHITRDHKHLLFTRGSQGWNALLSKIQNVKDMPSLQFKLTFAFILFLLVF